MFVINLSSSSNQVLFGIILSLEVNWRKLASLCSVFQSMNTSVSLYLFIFSVVHIFTSRKQKLQNIVKQAGKTSFKTTAIVDSTEQMSGF